MLLSLDDASGGCTEPLTEVFPVQSTDLCPSSSSVS